MQEVVDTPLGELILVASSRGLVRIGLPGANLADLADIADISDTDVELPRDRATLLTAATQLTEYFAAERQEFTVPLDLPAAQRQGGALDMPQPAGMGRAGDDDGRRHTLFGRDQQPRHPRPATEDRRGRPARDRGRQDQPGEDR